MTSLDSIDRAAALPAETPETTAVSSGELRRKAYHILAGGPAFALRGVSPIAMALLYTFLALWNTYIWRVLPDSYRALWRPNEHKRGVPTGLVLYCASVIALCLIFSQHKWMAATIWAVLAFGDGPGGLVGRALGGPRLPWNRGKGWLGTIGFIVFGTLGAATLMVWFLPVAFFATLPLAASLATACAFAESLPLPLDDNVTVPLAGAIALPLLMMVPALAF